MLAFGGETLSRFNRFPRSPDRRSGGSHAGRAPADEFTSQTRAVSDISDKSLPRSPNRPLTYVFVSRDARWNDAQAAIETSSRVGLDILTKGRPPGDTGFACPDWPRVPERT
jgi:hypothetical protein